MTTVSKAFTEARARLHEARRAESTLAFDLLVEYLKATQGDVSSKHAAEIFHKWRIPYPVSLYLMAREKAGVPLHKAMDWGSNSVASKRKREAIFRELYETTPEERRPRAVEPLSGEVFKQEIEKAAKIAQVRSSNFDVKGLITSPEAMFLPPQIKTLRDYSTQDLMGELKRRRSDAEEILKMLPPEAKP